MIESEYSASTEDRRQIARHSATRTNTRIFGVLIIITQIAICVIYGLLVQIPQRPTTLDITNFAPIFLTFASYFLIIVGFGALFAYERRLVWSAIGFNLLIVCITVQWFFLYNYFWRNTNLYYDHQPRFNSGRLQNSLFLSNEDIAGTDPTGATFTMALKAALANCVAFSFILGKAGPLEAFLVSWIGTFGFQLSRQVITLLENDYGYTYTVFVYGAFMGLMLGVFLNIKYKGQKTTARHPWYIGSPFSGAISLLGACILFCLFPILAMDIPAQFKGFGDHYMYTLPISVWYTISSAAIVSIAGSTIINGKPIARDLINGVVGGGVCGLTASFYLPNPLWAQLLGFAAGIVQIIGQSIIQTKSARSKPILATYSFTVFGVQGLLGGVWSSIFRKVIQNDFYRQGFDYNLENMPWAGWSLLIAVITMGIGLVFGILIGIILLIFGKHQRTEHFHDYTYWIPDDGIRYPLEYEYTSSQASSSIGEYYVHEVNDNVKNRNGYL